MSITPTGLDLQEMDCPAKLSLSGAVFGCFKQDTHCAASFGSEVTCYCEIKLAADQEPPVHVVWPLSVYYVSVQYVRGHRLWL